MPEANKKPIKDVLKADDVPTLATSRPIITSQEEVKDPMVTTGVSDVSSEESIRPPSSKKVISPAIKSEDQQDDSEVEPKPDDQGKPVNEETATVDAILGSKAEKELKSKEDKEAQERQELVDKLVVEKKYFLPINQVRKRRNSKIVIAIFGTIILLGGATLYAVSSGYIKLDFISKTSLSSKNDAVSNEQTSDSQKVAKTQPKTSKAPVMKGEPDASTANWVTVKSGQSGFSIKIPDGWEVTNFLEDNNIRGDSLNLSKGVPAKIDKQNTKFAGDGTVRLNIAQYKYSSKDSYSGEYVKKQEFSSGSLKGARYYNLYPEVPVDGIGPVPGSETYTYEFITQQTTTLVTYTIFNYNQYTRVTSPGMTKSDLNQIATVDSMVKTLEITQ